MDAPISSAVLLPEPQETHHARPAAPPPAGQKRRQSSVSEHDPKRPRLNSIDANASVDRRGSINGKAPAIGQGRRERGRERRLFGAALGALSQNSATAAQRKRSEIEKRQKAQRELEEQESDQRKLEREAQRKAQRQSEQKRFERESMRIRHENLRNMARFLQTKTEPRLYYKPWETTPEQDDRIQYQIEEAEETIRRELEGIDAQQKEDSERERGISNKTDAERDAGANSPIGKELIANAPQQQPIANGATNHSGSSPKISELMEDHADDFTSEAVSGDQAVEPSHNSIPASHEAFAHEGASKDAADENGEEVVEAAEDTVIY